MASNIAHTCAGAICSAATVEVILGVLLGWAIAASVIAAFRLIRPPRVISNEQRAMQEALHAATATLPHLRRGLSADSAGKTVGHLLTLTQARAVALLDSGARAGLRRCRCRPSRSC